MLGYLSVDIVRSKQFSKSIKYLSIFLHQKAAIVYVIFSLQVGLINSKLR